MALSSFSAAGTFVFSMPVLLLTLDGAVGSVPAAVVHGLLFTVVALERTNETRLQPSLGPSTLPTSVLTCSWVHQCMQSTTCYAWAPKMRRAFVTRAEKGCNFQQICTIQVPQAHLSFKKAHLSGQWTECFQPHNTGATFYSAFV